MAVEEQIEGIIKEVVENNGYELVEIKTPRWRNKIGLKVFIDKAGGVTIDDCVRLTRIIQDLIFEENLLENQDYRLEVSSPGVDRPLRTLTDFKRNIGKVIELNYYNEDEIKTISGKITNVYDEIIEITSDDTIKNNFSTNEIEKAKIKLPW